MKQKGFTLIELILYIAIMGIVILAASGLYSLIVTSQIKNEAMSEVDGQGAQIMQIITQDIRNAAQVSIPSSPGSSGTTLTLTYPDSTTTTFALQGTTLLQNGTLSLNSSQIGVSSILFSNTSPNTTVAQSIRVQFTLVNTHGKELFTYSKQFIDSADVQE